MAGAVGETGIDDGPNAVTASGFERRSGWKYGGQCPLSFAVLWEVYSLDRSTSTLAS